MHICPECGVACHCSGDIEDHDTGDAFVFECAHCLDDEDEPDDLAEYGDDPPAPERCPDTEQG